MSGVSLPRCRARLIQVNIRRRQRATVREDPGDELMVSLPFRDRDEAARHLAAALEPYRGTHPVVLAIPRGAVPMGRIVAEALDGEIESVTAANVEEAARLVEAILAPGDIVLVKASNSVGLAALVDRVAGAD